MSEAGEEVPQSPEGEEQQVEEPQVEPEEEQETEGQDESAKEQETTEEKETDEQGSRPPSTARDGAPEQTEESPPQQEEEEEEEVELDENLNYLNELKSILEKFNSLKQIESENDKIDSLQADLKNYKRNIKGSKLYFAHSVKVTTELRETIADIVQDIFNKIKEEHRPFEKTGDKQSRSELTATANQHKANAAKLKAMEQLQEILQLSTECEESAAEATAELAKSEQLAEELDEATGALKNQMAAESENQQDGGVEEQDEAARQAELEKEKELEEERRQEEERLAEEKRLQEEEERAARLKEEEERRAKYEPTTWPVFSYKGEGDDEEEIILVVRAPPDSLQQSQFSVSLENELTSTFKLDTNEELVSSIVHLKTQGDEKLEANGPIWIALPHVFPKGTNYREPWIKICMGTASQEEEKVEWANVTHSRETQIPEIKTKFVESAFDAVSEMSMAVVSRIKEDVGQVNNKGGKISSTVDTRCNIMVPKNAFKSLTEFGLKLFPVDNKVMDDLKNGYNKQAGNLIAMSPFVDIRLDNKNMKKPVIFSISNPGAARKRNDQAAGKPGTNDNKAPLTVKGTAVNNLDGANESLTLFILKENSQWTIDPEPAFTYERDVVSFKMTTIIKKFILIRTQGEITQLDGVFIIKHIIEKTRDVTAHMVVRQNDYGEVSIHCVRTDKLDKLVDRLNGQHFTEGESSKHLTLSEGQVITMKFRGNVNFEDREERKFQFNSNRETGSCAGMVSVVDRYQQHGLEVFRGHVQFFTEPEMGAAPPANQQQKDKGSQAGPKPRLLCELPVAIQKPEYETTQVSRAAIKIREQGPLTNDYVDQLSKEVGDEWRQMAKELGLSATGIQRIILRSQDGELEQMVKDMLITWYKTAKSSTDKVQLLFHTFKICDRDDLAKELEQKNHQFQVESENKKQEAKWKKAYRAVTDSPKAIKNWTELGKALEIDEGIINDISQKTQISEREKVWEMLTKWREDKGEDSSREILVQSLKSCKLIEASENVHHIG